MSRHAIALPDEDRGWNLWSGSGVPVNGRELDEVCGNRADVVVGVPATQSTTFTVTLPTTEESLFDSMVFAQIEKRGLGGATLDDTVFQYEIIQQEGNETLLSVDVLSPDFPEAWCLPRAAGYAPSARLLHLPEDQLLVYAEHRRLVLAVNRHGRLTHLQALSAEPSLTAAAAQEINLTVLSLQGEGLIAETPDLVVSGDFKTNGDFQEFEKSLVMPAELRREKPRLKENPELQDAFLPALVRNARKRRSSGRRNLVIGLFAAAAYVAIGVFLWFFAKSTEASIALLKEQVTETQPGVDEILRTEQRWRELEPAFNLRYYPLVQLNEITRILPASGVLIRQFETRGTSVFVRGQARDVQLAARLKEEIEQDPAFEAYQWIMPNPKVDQNNTATFEIQGTPNNGTTE